MRQKTINKLKELNNQLKFLSETIGSSGIKLSEFTEILKAISPVEKQIDIAINKLDPKGSVIPKKTIKGQ